MVWVAFCYPGSRVLKRWGSGGSESGYGKDDGKVEELNQDICATFYIPAS